MIGYQRNEKEVEVGKVWEKRWLFCRRDTLTLMSSTNRHLFGSSDHFQRAYIILELSSNDDCVKYGNW